MLLTGFCLRLIERSSLLFWTSSFTLSSYSILLLSRSSKSSCRSCTPRRLIMLFRADSTLRLSPPLKAKAEMRLWSMIKTRSDSGQSRKNWSWLLLRFWVSWLLLGTPAEALAGRRNQPTRVDWRWYWGVSGTAGRGLTQLTHRCGWSSWKRGRANWPVLPIFSSPLWSWDR